MKYLRIGNWEERINPAGTCLSSPIDGTGHAIIRQTDRQEERRTGGQADKRTGRQEDRVTGEQADRRTGRQENRQT